MKQVITGSDIIKTYGKREENKALDGVNITISQGEFTAVMGPSGCGKSTLLFALSGMDSISGGSVKFGDQELSSLNESTLAEIRKTRMGFVFQQPTMLKNLNLIDNLILPATKQDRSAAIQKAELLMEQTGIAGLGSRDITEVSGGQLQRAGICRALINAPEIIFADEPTGALNSKSADEIMELLTKINQEGTALLLVTHDAKVAARADRVLFMKDGKTVSELSLGKFRGKDLQSRTDRVVLQMSSIDI